MDDRLAPEHPFPAALDDVMAVLALRDEAMDYAVRLMRAGVATEPHVFPGTCHGFDAFLPEWDTSLQLYAIQGAAVMRAFMHNHS